VKVKKNKEAKAEIKIAYLGGGSRGWAPHLMSDLALCPNLTGQLRLYDINFEAAKANVEVSVTIFGHRDAQTSFEVTAVKTMKEALDGADFVVISIEPGPITMRYADLEIPAKYGILQPVGDTTAPGGILRALRSVPIYEGFARQIMAYCPKAWVINYTNPMTICTASLYAVEPEIKAFGCCHEVFGTQQILSSFVSKWFGVPEPDRAEIQLDIAGVNHFTFASAASWKGNDLFPHLRGMVGKEGFFADHTAEALMRKEKQLWFDHDALIAFDYFRRFGVLGAAGDRHLAEFVPWYLGSEEDLQRWGVILTPYSWRVERMKSFSQRSADAPLEPSGEEGVEQMQALLGIKPLVSNVNIPNRGQMAGFPEEAVVETYAQFLENEVRPIVSRPLPEMLESIILHIVQIQMAVLEAALERDRDLAFQALLNDPLVRIPTDKAWEMFLEMLDHVKDLLPGFEG
jgi:alpha-galactosidase